MHGEDRAPRGEAGGLQGGRVVEDVPAAPPAGTGSTGAVEATVTVRDHAGSTPGRGTSVMGSRAASGPPGC